jgi:hypothetical protein
VFSLHFQGFQNGSFYTSKRPILSREMIHFGEQNGPFCDVKRLVLKNVGCFVAILYGFFTQKERIGLLK